MVVLKVCKTFDVEEGGRWILEFRKGVDYALASISRAKQGLCRISRCNNIERFQDENITLLEAELSIG